MKRKWVRKQPCVACNYSIFITMASLLRTAASAQRRAIASSTRREFSALLTPVEEFPG